MGDLHDRAVEEIYQHLNHLINEYDEEVFWDEVYMEQDYFEGQIDPRRVPDREDKGSQVGEFDVLAVSNDPQAVRYVEVKPWSSGTSYAEEQINRAESFWEPRNWDVYGSVYRVPEWAENWYDENRDVDLDDVNLTEDSGPVYSADIDADIDRYITDVEREMLNELG